jgi:hypothetical protein
MSLRFSVAAGIGLRGAGLGNESIAWGKSFLAAQALGARMMRPRWMLNRYRIAKAMGWNQASLACSRIATLPFKEIEITEEMYRRTGEVDYGAAVKKIIESSGLSQTSIVVKNSGMWGGYAAIRRARPFLRHQLQSAPGVIDALSNLEASATAVNVGVHVRVGDFAMSPPGPGQFNRSLPLSWYREAIISLRGSLGGRVNFWICSDAPDARLGELTEIPGVTVFRGAGPSAAVQELVLLTLTDLLIPSVSSFSMLGIFISDSPYLWFKPQLSKAGPGLALWAQEREQQRPDSQTSLHAAMSAEGDVSRGRPWNLGEPIDADLSLMLERVRQLREERTDLLYYGVVRDQG